MKSQIKGKQCKFLCTNCHVISQKLVDSKIEFSIYYGKKNDETKKIKRKDLLNALKNQKMFVLLKL